MNAKIYPLILCFCCCWVSCEKSQDSVRRLGSGVGIIQIRDIREAQTYRKVLPGHLGLTPPRVRVDPGAGVTHVKIIGVQSSDEQARINQELRQLNAKNPQLNPLQWRFTD